MTEAANLRSIVDLHVHCGMVLQLAILTRESRHSKSLSFFLAGLPSRGDV